jgi:hypothetical protein
MNKYNYIEHSNKPEQIKYGKFRHRNGQAKRCFTEL